MPESDLLDPDHVLSTTTQCHPRRIPKEAYGIYLRRPGGMHWLLASWRTEEAEARVFAGEIRNQAQGNSRQLYVHVTGAVLYRHLLQQQAVALEELADNLA